MPPELVYASCGKMFSEWWVDCAKCGNEYPLSERTKQKAVSQALKDGWVRLYGKWYCAACYAEF